MTHLKGCVVKSGRLNNAERLGNLINMKQFNFSQLNKIKGSLYQHYYGQDVQSIQGFG